MSSKISNFDAVWIVYDRKKSSGKKAKMLWFSASDIQELNDYLQINGRSGVRIYAGRYANHKHFQNVNGQYDYRKKNTIVMIPTIHNGTEHVDEIPADEVEQIVEDIKAGNFPDPLVAFNHGELCPPNCTGETVDDLT